MYFGLNALRGYVVGPFHRAIADDDRAGIDPLLLTQRLIAILEHAFRNVPYFGTFAPPGGRVKDPFYQLRQMPLLSKDLIRKLGANLCSRDLKSRKWFRNTSGGSTGEPVVLIQDAEYAGKQLAVTATFSRWAGKEIGERELRLWGSERDILKGSIGFRNHVKNWLTNTRFVNAFRMSGEDMVRYVDIINRFKPKLVVAYAQSAFELARFALKHDLKITAPKGIITSAGILLPNMRKTIEAAFGASVFNRYGSREVGDVACQCSYRGALHVAPWSAYVEVLDEAGSPVPVGTEGEIVVTSLINYAMPLIRYRIGDRGVLAPEGSCPCGRRGQILDRLVGRTVDVFVRTDGTLVDGEYFTHLMYFRDCVRKFQIVQTNFHQVQYLLVSDGRRLPQQEVEEIIAGTKAAMGNDCDVQLEYVPDIAPLPSGKFRFTISKVSARTERLDRQK